MPTFQFCPAAFLKAVLALVMLFAKCLTFFQSLVARVNGSVKDRRVMFCFKHGAVDK